MEIADRSKELIALLFQEPDLRDKIYPFLSEKYFDDYNHSKIVSEFLKLREKNSKFPSAADMRFVLTDEAVRNSFDECLKASMDVAPEIKQERIREWFKTRMTLETLREMTDGLEGRSAESILPYLDKLREMVAFDFDTTIGLNFYEDADRLYDYMHEKNSVIRTGIDSLDEEIGGGWHEKTLSLLIAPSNVGKTLCKCSFAVNAFLAGKNVLYVTMEMSEEEISKRLYVNVANISMQELTTLSREEFKNGYAKLIGKTNRMFVKEYPTASASANTLRSLLKELKLKQKFKPDIIFVDYLGIMQPNHQTAGDNTNTKFKVISEELRGFAVEQQVAVVSSNQTNRGGYGKAEVGLTDTADSIGQVMTADLILTIGQDNEMRDNGQYNFITSKNRFNRAGKVIPLSVDFYRMKVYEESEEDRVDKSLQTMRQVTARAERSEVESARRVIGLK